MKHKLLFIIFVFTSALYAQNTLSIDSLSVPSTQSSVIIPINLSAEESFAGYQFTLNYNSSIMKVTKVTAGNIASGFSLLTNLNSPGTVRVAAVDSTLIGVTGSGVLAYVTFEITGSGTSSLSLSGVKLNNKEGKNLQVRAINGRIVIKDTAAGPSDNEEQAPAEEDTTQTQPEIVTGNLQIPISSQTNTFPVIEQPSERIPAHRVEKEPIIREREVASTTTTGDIVKRDQGKFSVNSQPFEPSASGNLVLFVQSEYPYTRPPTGYTTYKKGATLSCEVEKEVVVNEMEKAVCIGFKGTGSAPSSGNSNKTTFQISEDTILTWLWKKMPVEKDFVLEVQKKFEIEDELKIPMKAIYYGGLKDPIKLTVSGFPESVSISLKKKEITYSERENQIVLKKTGEIPPGEYNVNISAICGDLKKNYEIILLVAGKITKSIIKESNSISLILQSKNNMDVFDSFMMDLYFPADRVSLKQISPDSVHYKIAGRNTLAIAGNSEGKILNISFDIKQPSDDISLDIKSFIAKDKTGKKIPIHIIPE